MDIRAVDGHRNRDCVRPGRDHDNDSLDAAAWVPASQRCLGHIRSAGGNLHRATVGYSGICAGRLVSAVGASDVGRAVAHACVGCSDWRFCGWGRHCGRGWGFAGTSW